jgi:hypothetical protein
MKLVLVVSFILLMLGCPKIKYENDTLIPSAVAGSPEYPVSINAQWCKDSKGVHGFCAIRIDEGSDITIKIIAKPYAYRLDLQCLKNGSWSKSIDVLADKPLELTIKADEFKGQYAFSCIGDIYPHDRPTPTAAFFEARFRVVKKGYVPLEATYRQDTFQVFGKFAYNVQLWDGKNWVTQMRMPVAEIANTPSIVESYNMRLNVYGF